MPQYLSPGVYVEEVDRGPKPIEGVGTAVAAFVGFAEQGPTNEPRLIANWSQFLSTYGGFIPGAYLAHSVYGFFNNGGTTCYVVRLPGGNGKGGAKATAALPGRKPGIESLRVTALEEGRAGEDIAVEVAPAGEGAPEDAFTVRVRRGEQTENFENVSLSRARGARNVVETVNRESRLIRVEIAEAPGSLAERLPQPGQYRLATGARTLALAGMTADTFVGNAPKREGMGGLEAIDEITVVCAPDLMAAHRAGQLSMDALKAVQLGLLNHCEKMKDRFAILDAPPGMSPQEIKEWRADAAGYDSKYGALYYPWIKVANPLGNGELISIPPSGHLAGIYARTDAERGVHKAPANEVVRGTVDLDARVTRGEQDILNPLGINCIRAFPARGIRVWGARTLSSDPAWRYINVRRLFNFVEESIEEGTQWVVFEPNDAELWGRIRRDISAFLTRVWRDGALFGNNPDEAFYVKCDAELNPPEVRDVGQLIVEIGIAPVKPAEFVIFRITQRTLATGQS